MAREWLRLGHNVTVVAASESHVRNVPPKIDKNAITEEWIDGIRYVWLKTPPYEDNHFARIRNMLIFVAQLWVQKSRIVDIWVPDIVIASSTYPLDIYPARQIALKYKAVLVYEVHDLWPLSPMEIGGYSRSHPYIIFLQYAENYCYLYADFVVSMLPKAQPHMIAHGMAKEKFVYIPNGVDPTEWFQQNESLPEEHEKILSKMKQMGNYLVGYTGAHGIANSLHTLIEAAYLINGLNVIFLIIGEGPEKRNLERLASKLRLENVIFLPPVRKAAIPTLLSWMDILYIGLKRQPLFRFGVSPNKLIDYMMAGKPIIYAIESSNDIVAESECGLSVLAEDPTAIAIAIRKVISMSHEERGRMGRRGRQYALGNHNYKFLAQRFLDAMKKSDRAKNH